MTEPPLGAGRALASAMGARREAGHAVPRGARPGRSSGGHRWAVPARRRKGRVGERHRRAAQAQGWQAARSTLAHLWKAWEADANDYLRRRIQRPNRKASVDSRRGRSCAFFASALFTRSSCASPLWQKTKSHGRRCRLRKAMWPADARCAGIARRGERPARRGPEGRGSGPTSELRARAGCWMRSTSRIGGR